MTLYLTASAMSTARNTRQAHCTGVGMLVDGRLGNALAFEVSHHAANRFDGRVEDLSSDMTDDLITRHFHFHRFANRILDIPEVNYSLHFLSSSPHATICGVSSTSRL